MLTLRLTKQFEGGLRKCGNYWSEQTYGHLRLQLVSESGGTDVVDQSRESGFDFGTHVPEERQTQSGNIKRVFHLWHKDEGPRKITQIQCLTWPDFDVPDSPEVLLTLKKDVDNAIEEMCTGANDPCNLPPILVHCSAGVGRTGSYILVDAIAEGLRRELLGRGSSRRSATCDHAVSESGKSVTFADLLFSRDESPGPILKAGESTMDIDEPSKGGPSTQGGNAVGSPSSLPLEPAALTPSSSSKSR